jgi:energy-coupling factor transport system ATP-binding protein
VDEEVAAGPVNLGLAPDEVRRRTLDTMRALGVDDLAAEPPLALSRGQRLRVALASLLSMTPRLLLLDEPTTGQDRVQVESMMDHLVGSLDDRAVIFCTHDVLTAARYATRLVVLSEGTVLASGTPAEVFADAEVLDKARLKAPAAVEIARELGLPPVVSVDEIVAHLRGGILR